MLEVSFDGLIGPLGTRFHMSGVKVKTPVHDGRFLNLKKPADEIGQIWFTGWGLATSPCDAVAVK